MSTPLTSAQIQTMIDAKWALIGVIVNNINTANNLILQAQTSPKPSYSIDNQNVDWNGFINAQTNYIKVQTENQMREMDAVMLLMGRFANLNLPFMLVSQGV